MSNFYSTVKQACLDEWHFLQRSTWDRALVTWMPLVIVAMMVALFWQAVPRALPIVVVDESHSTLSRDILRKVDSTPGVRVVAQPVSLNTAWPYVEKNQAHAVLYIPTDIDKEVANNQPATLFSFYNATMTTAGGTAVREMEAVLKELNQEVAIEYNAFSMGPSVLHFVMCVAMTSAYAREIRDKTIQIWINRAGGHTAGAIIGKALPYVFLFSLYGVASIYWIAYIRGDGIPGSLTALLLGNVLLYCAYAAIALMIAGMAPDMSSALSAVGLYAGTSLAFCGATFPIDGASLFARVWHHLLPFSTFVKLDVAERYINAPASLTLFYLFCLLLFVVIPGLIGFMAYRKVLNTPDRWGQR